MYIPTSKEHFFNVTVLQDVQMLPSSLKIFIREKKLFPSNLPKHKQEIKM